MNGGFWKYSNGWGHLVMSIIATIAGMIMMLFSHDPVIQGLGVTIVLTVNGYWFASGSLKQLATEITEQMNQRTVVVEQKVVEQKLMPTTSDSHSTTTTHTHTEDS